MTKEIGYGWDFDMEMRKEPALGGCENYRLTEMKMEIGISIEWQKWVLNYKLPMTLNEEWFERFKYMKYSQYN